MDVQSRVIFWARIALILFVFLSILFVMHAGQILFIPLFAGFLVATLLYPVERFFERLHLKTSLAALLTVILFIAVLVFIFLLINFQLNRFFRDLTNYREKLEEIITNAHQWIAHKLHLNDGINTDSEKPIDEIFGAIRGFIGPTLLTSLKMLALIVVFLLFTFFILVFRKLLARFILSFFQTADKQKANDVILSIRKLINSYLLGLLSEMGIVFTLLFIVFLIMGLKYALLMALLGALLNIIPYIGIYTAGAISMLMAVTYGTTNQSIEVGIVFIVVHFIDANLLIPYIVGQRVKINPFMALIAMIAGELIWGIAGMFLFIPLTAILRIILENTKDLRPWAILMGGEKAV